MTYNQVIKRIKNICLSHKQIRSFYRDFSQDLLADHTRKYPAVFMEESGGLVSTNGHNATFSFRLSFWDLVHVSEDTKDNEQDVDSDMISICLDIVAQINHGDWGDWRLSSENQMQIVISEGNDDMYGGCTIDFTISIIFAQNVCAVPSDLFYDSNSTGDNSNGGTNKSVYDLNYIATGTEGMIITIPALSGKNILFITRESAPLYKVSSAPDAAEYTWDNTTIVMGVNATVNERFLILYRNY